jgi:hypothetical protein
MRVRSWVECLKKECESMGLEYVWQIQQNVKIA